MNLERMYFFEELLKIVEPILALVAEKNELYGDSYYRLRNEYGKQSFLIRLTDKFNRLKALNKKYPCDTEIDRDTIVDIIGYCLLELLYRKMQKEVKDATS